MKHTAFVLDTRDPEGNIIYREIIPLNNITYFSWNVTEKIYQLFTDGGFSWNLTEMQYNMLLQMYSIHTEYNEQKKIPEPPPCRTIKGFL